MENALIPAAAARKKYFFSLFLFVLFASCFGYWLRDAGEQLELRVEMSVAQPETAQLFYDLGAGYAETESVTRPLAAGVNRITIALPPTPIVRLRFDPVASSASATVTSIELRRGRYLPWQAIALGDWQAIGATHVTRTASGAIQLVEAVTADPQLEFSPSAPLSAATRPGAAIDIALLAIVLALCATAFVRACWAAPIKVVRRGIPAAIALAAGLILAMALISVTDRSVHPDEYSHLAAYDFFSNRWLPPAVDDAATVPSLSIWGYSYLFEMDVVYDIAAHLTAPLYPLTHDPLRSARLFQFALWIALGLLALWRRGWYWPLSVLLLSPQVWYVFAYFNADALPFFLALVAAAAIAERDNGLHDYLRGGAIRQSMVWIVAICIGVLLISKRNYLPVVPALLLWLAAMHLRLRTWTVLGLLSGLLAVQLAVFLGDLTWAAVLRWSLAVFGVGLGVVVAAIALREWWKDAVQRAIVVRLVCFTLLCIAIAVPRVLWDLHVNGGPGEKGARIHAVEEAHAGADFKPSRIAAGGGEPTIALASRGVSLSEVIFAPHHWAYRSATSAFGVYGYMSVFAPLGLYAALIAAALAFALFGVIGLRMAHPERWPALLWIAVGAWVLIAMNSLLLNWIGWLQPQGRYLLPALPVLALLLGRRASGEGTALRGGAVVLAIAFVLALASFAGVALPAFAR